jgi:FlaA1/EpsC-like NDP-sugar epimerase
MESLRRTVVGLPRATKTLIVLSVDLAGFAICGIFAYWVAAGGNFDLATAWPVILLTAGVSIIAAWSRGLYRAVIRYVGIEQILASVLTAGIAALAGAVIAYFMSSAGVPIRWSLGYWGFAVLFLGGSRYVARRALLKRPQRGKRESVIIYGAGDAGAQLAISLQAAGDFLPVAMIDDDGTLYGKEVKGLTVHLPKDLERLIRVTDATRVLLAIPSASRHHRRRVLERLTEFPIHVQTMPDLKDIVSGKAQVDDIRDVDVQDLLGRNAVPPDPKLLDASVAGKNVLVTGAGGSIGAELCRQIFRLKPASLVLFELSEPALYNIDQELRRMAAEEDEAPEILALLGSVHHEERIKEVMRTFSIHAVYHAAAYKHLPIVECNIFEGIHNNVLGTLHAVRAAIATKVETFVLVSTDKAVNPTSVMGATKRLAELVVQAYTNDTLTTRMCIVRFGNVLESSGSVVPLFKKQIRNGGPVTVTHREIIRYFMTIPEAAQLVIQAGSMAKGGDVFVLDMGKPVRIYDLACRMIKLMGLTVRDASNPDGDIEIAFTGLRPAEKLFEELLIGGNVYGTEHPRILRADEDSLSQREIDECIAELTEASATLDHGRAREALLAALREYSPTNGIDDLVWLRKTGTENGNMSSHRVVDFPKKPV